MRLLTASVDLARGILDVVDRRFRAGDLAVLDVHLVRAAFARAQAERAAGEAEQATTLGRLRALLGLEHPVAVRGDLIALTPPDATALATAANQRPELASSRPASARPRPT